jgi:hypothetical protein
VAARRVWVNMIRFLRSSMGEAALRAAGRSRGASGVDLAAPKTRIAKRTFR